MTALIQGLGSQGQKAPVQRRPFEQGSLGQLSSQLYPFQVASHTLTGTYGLPFVAHSTKLQLLKRKRFTTQGRIERIQRSLAALNQPETFRLTPQQWRFFAEDPDLDDQD